jgi:hypothetical protein
MFGTIAGCRRRQVNNGGKPLNDAIGSEASVCNAVARIRIPNLEWHQFVDAEGLQASVGVGHMERERQDVRIQDRESRELTRLFTFEFDLMLLLFRM